MSVFLLLLGYGSAYADQFLLSASSHALIDDFSVDPGAAIDLVLTAEWIPIPQITIGIEGAILKPLVFSGDEEQVALSLRATPIVRIRFGDARSWAYLKLGAGWDNHLMDGSTESVFVLVSSAGYVVEPAQLDFFFGFEISCQLGTRGELSRQIIGLGGLVGLSF